MKRSFFFLLAGLILTLSSVQAEARTVTAPAIYWQYYNAYAQMAARMYNSLPPMYRPMSVPMEEYKGVNPWLNNNMNSMNSYRNNKMNSWKNKSVRKKVITRKKPAIRQKNIRGLNRRLKKH